MRGAGPEQEEAQAEWEHLQETLDHGSTDATPRQQAARLRAARERVERLERALAELNKVAAARETRKKGDGQHARVSTTDPECRIMKMADGGFRPAYNVQLATTLNSYVNIGLGVINSGSDRGQMAPMIVTIAAQQGIWPNKLFTDGGFSTIDDIETVGQNGVTVYTPVKETKRRTKEGKNPFEPQKGDGPEVAKGRERMGSEAGREKYTERCKCE